MSGDSEVSDGPLGQSAGADEGAPRGLPRPISRRRVVGLIGGSIVLATGGGIGLLARGRGAGAPAPSPAPAAAAATDAPPGGARSDADEEWPPPPLGLSAEVPTRFTFRIPDAVPQSEVDLLREAGDIARDFYRTQTGYYLTGRPGVRLDVTQRDGPLGESGGQTVTIFVGHRGWPRLSRTERIGVMCHEVFHLYQWTLARGGYPTPIYLVEGSAEYAATAATSDRGLGTREAARQRNIAFVRRYPQPPIASANRAAEAGVYPLGELAVDQLVGNGGVPLLASYFRRLRDEAPVDAFPHTFGETREAFEARFEAWRRDNGIGAR